MSCVRYVADIQEGHVIFEFYARKLIMFYLKGLRNVFLGTLAFHIYFKSDCNYKLGAEVEDWKGYKLIQCGSSQTFHI